MKKRLLIQEINLHKSKLADFENKLSYSEGGSSVFPGNVSAG